MAKQQQKRYSDFVTEWEHLLSTVATNSADVPHLEVPRAKLQAFLDQVRALAKEHDLHTANRLAVSQRLKVALGDGKKLATFLRTGLKEHYGNRSEKLVEFGISPFRRRKKETPAVKPPEGETPSPEVKPTAR
jgi:hypothetical protein